MTVKTRRDFFISFSSVDRAWAEWIAKHLRSAGYAVFYQHSDFRAGNNFIIKMHEAASLADRVIAVLSDDYLNSTYTQPEWATALAKDPTGAERRLILIKVQPCSPTGLLRQLVFVDLVGLPDHQAREVLLRAVADIHDDDIGHLPNCVDSTDPASVIELVRDAREHVCPVLLRRYSKFTGLAPDRPMELQPLFTDVYIFEKIPRNERKTIAEIICEAEQSGSKLRFARIVTELRRLPAMEVIERFPRLMILGGPGSGKTTLLRRLALLCARGHYRFRYCSNISGVSRSWRRFTDGYDQVGVWRAGRETACTWTYPIVS
jgi:TIR domain